MTEESRLSIDPPVALPPAQVLEGSLKEADNLVNVTVFGQTKDGKWHIASSIPLTDSVKDAFDLFLASGILEGRQDLICRSL